MKKKIRVTKEYDIETSECGEFCGGDYSCPQHYNGTMCGLDKKGKGEELKTYTGNCWLQYKRTEFCKRNEVKEAEQSALDIIIQYGGIDGAHHKDWVLDQVVRTLIGDDIKYKEWVSLAKSGEDGENTYEYNEGIAP
jgi:hypothetical protein